MIHSGSPVVSNLQPQRMRHYQLTTHITNSKGERIPVERFRCVERTSRLNGTDKIAPRTLRTPQNAAIDKCEPVEHRQYKCLNQTLIPITPDEVQRNNLLSKNIAPAENDMISSDNISQLNNNKSVRMNTQCNPGSTFFSPQPGNRTMAESNVSPLYNLNPGSKFFPPQDGRRTMAESNVSPLYNLNPGSTFFSPQNGLRPMAESNVSPLYNVNPGSTFLSPQDGRRTMAESNASPLYNLLKPKHDGNMPSRMCPLKNNFKGYSNATPLCQGNNPNSYSEGMTMPFPMVNQPPPIQNDSFTNQSNNGYWRSSFRNDSHIPSGNFTGNCICSFYNNPYSRNACCCKYTMINTPKSQCAASTQTITTENATCQTDASFLAGKVAGTPRTHLKRIISAKRKKSSIKNDVIRK